MTYTNYSERLLSPFLNVVIAFFTVFALDLRDAANRRLASKGDG